MPPKLGRVRSGETPSSTLLNAPPPPPPPFLRLLFLLTSCLILAAAPVHSVANGVDLALDLPGDLGAVPVFVLLVVLPAVLAVTMEDSSVTSVRIVVDE